MTAGTQYVYDGAAWQAANSPATPPANQVDNYPAPGSYSITPPVGARFFWFEGIGSGGGRAGAGNTYQCGAGGGEYTDGVGAVEAFSWPQTLVVADAAGTNLPGNPTTFAGMIAAGGEPGSASTSAATGSVWPPGGGAGTSIRQTTAPAYTPNTAGGWGAPDTNNGRSSRLGGGGGSKTGTPGTGGTDAAALGRLQAGNGGNSTTPPTAPGGGAGAGSQPMVPGGARITWIF